MRRGALIIATLLALLFGHVPLAGAQIAPTPGSAAPTATAEPEPGVSPLAGLTAWIVSQQRAMHRELVRGMRALSQTHAPTAAWALIVASFLYGVFHAVGPGHGKAIIATYLATQPYRIQRGLWLSAAGAFAQGLTAIAIVYGLVLVAGWLPRDTQTAVNWSERASFALVILIGAGLAWRALRGILGHGHDHGHGAAHERTHGRVRDHRHPPDHGHAHGHAHDGHERHGHHGHDHRHDHADGGAPDHVHDAHCGHVHAPTDAMIARAVDWRATAGIVASIGMRPCTGAILVLVLATTLDLHLAGIAAVFAMSAGTALALGAIGIVVIQARSWAVGALAGRGGDGALRLERLTYGVALIGGCLVALLGASLLAASFGPAHPLGL